MMRAQFGLPSVKSGETVSAPFPLFAYHILYFSGGSGETCTNKRQIRDPILHGVRYPSTIFEDCREERVPGSSLGSVSCPFFSPLVYRC